MCVIKKKKRKKKGKEWKASIVYFFSSKVSAENTQMVGKIFGEKFPKRKKEQQ